MVQARLVPRVVGQDYCYSRYPVKARARYVLQVVVLNSLVVGARCAVAPELRCCQFRHVHVALADVPDAALELVEELGE